MPPEDRRRAAVPVLWALAAYAALTAGWLHDLLPALAHAYAHDAGDPALNTWILWWNSRVLPFSAAWWNAPSFYPAHGVTGFSELLVAANLISTPVQWLTGNPVLAYNVLLVLSFPLSALAAYLLAFELTGDRRAAFLAGIAYGFAPYRISHLPHVQVLSAYWIPLALFALHRYLRARRARWLVLFASAWLLQAFSNGYYLIFLTLFVAAWAGWFLARPGQWRALAAVAFAGGVAALPVLPVLLGYRAIQQRFGLTRGIGEIIDNSARLSSFLHASPENAVWGWLHAASRPEAELFPGLTILLIVALGFVLSFRTALPRDAAPEPVSRALRITRRVFATIGFLGAAMSLSVVVLGPWKLRLGTTPLVSVGAFYKPFTLVILSAVALAVTHRRFLAACRARSVFAFYVLAGVFVAIACLGPEPTVLGQRVFYKPPYALLLSLPGFFGLRVPTRFWMLGILCLATAGAIAFARLVPAGARRSRVLTAVAAVGLALDAWPTGLPIVPAPTVLACPSAAERPAAFLQLPIGDVAADIAAMNRAMARGIPAINGYSGYYAPHYVALSTWLGERDRLALEELAAMGPIEVAVDAAADRDRLLIDYVAAFPGAREVPHCGSTLRVFELPREPARPRPPGPVGIRLPIATLRSDVQEKTAEANDGNPRSAWSAPQLSDHWLMADLGRPSTIAGVTLFLGPRFSDFPRALRIDASIDGATWVAIRDGSTCREAYWGGLIDPKWMPLTFDLGGVRARYVRLTQHGRDDHRPWSIAEIALSGGQ